MINPNLFNRLKAVRQQRKLEKFQANFTKEQEKLRAYFANSEDDAFKQKKADLLENSARNAIWELGQVSQDLDLSIAAFVWGRQSKDYQRLIRLSKQLREQAEAVETAISNLRYINSENYDE